MNPSDASYRPEQASAVVAAFWAHHGITSPKGTSLAEPAIVPLEIASRIFTAAFDQTPTPQETSGIVLRALENLSDRLYEQAAGMLVCLGTGSAAAAETIARTVIEGAFNLLFIVSRDHEARLFAFFHRYLQEHDRKLREWQQFESTKAQTPEQTAILHAIAVRASAHQTISEFVKRLGEGLGFQQVNALSQYWPNTLYERCEQINKAGQYLTSYHRLSASSHINAEETIRWLFGYYHAAIGQNAQLLQNLSLESVNYSAMITRIAVDHYIEASTATCCALSADLDHISLRKTRSELHASIDTIAPATGAQL